jgi:hypothetical protein
MARYSAGRREAPRCAAAAAAARRDPVRSARWRKSAKETARKRHARQPAARARAILACRPSRQSGARPRLRHPKKVVPAVALKPCAPTHRAAKTVGCGTANVLRNARSSFLPGGTAPEQAEQRRSASGRRLTQRAPGAHEAPRTRQRARGGVRVAKGTLRAACAAVKPRLRESDICQVVIHSHRLRSAARPTESAEGCQRCHARVPRAWDACPRRAARAAGAAAGDTSCSVLQQRRAASRPLRGACRARLQRTRARRQRTARKTEGG